MEENEHPGHSLPLSLPPSLPSYLVELTSIPRVEHIAVDFCCHDGHLGRE